MANLKEPGRQKLTDQIGETFKLESLADLVWVALDLGVLQRHPGVANIDNDLNPLPRAGRVRQLGDVDEPYRCSFAEG